MSKVIVELVDKNSGFADHVGRVNFSAAKVVQEVNHTDPIKNAIRQGVLVVTTAKRLEEWKQERQDYIDAHIESKKAANAASDKASVTLRERYNSTVNNLATEKATVKTLKKEKADLAKELETLKLELEALKAPKKVSKK